MKIAVVIPARYESSRLPGKPLIELVGGSMIRRTHHRVVSAVDRSIVWVATDDERIARHCQDAGMQVLMTPTTCLTGTDRIAAAAAVLDADVFVNVQGDEPVIDPINVRTMIDAVRAHPDRIYNGVSAVDAVDAYRNSSTPKVVARPDGRLLYISRAPIPANKAGTFIAARKQVCVYAFPRAALLAFARHGKKTPLEEIEDIEILRFLELGYDVHMLELPGVSVAVDNPADVARAEAAIRALDLERAF